MKKEVQQPNKTQAFAVDKVEAKEVLPAPKEKCEGCKRAEGSDSIYTCNCGVETPKECNSVDAEKLLK